MCLHVCMCVHMHSVCLHVCLCVWYLCACVCVCVHVHVCGVCLHVCLCVWCVCAYVCGTYVRVCVHACACVVCAHVCVCVCVCECGCSWHTPPGPGHAQHSWQLCLVSSAVCLSTGFWTNAQQGLGAASAGPHWKGSGTQPWLGKQDLADPNCGCTRLWPCCWSTPPQKSTSQLEPESLS